MSLLRQTFLGIGAFLALSAIALIFLRQGWGVEFFLPGKNREVLNVLAFSLRQDPQLFLVPLLLGVASYSIYRALSNDGLAKSCALLALCFLSVAYLIQSTFVTLLAQLQSPKCFAEAVQKNLSKDQNLYQWQDRFFAMHYYLDRDLPVAHEMRTLPNYSCLLVKEENLFSLDAEGRKYRIAITSDNAAADGRHKLVLVCLD